MRRKARGLTLVESMVTTGVLAVLAGTAVPSFQAMLDRQRVQGAAEVLKGDVQHLRAESVRRREPLYLSVSTGTSGSCYVLHPQADACSCKADGTAACSAGVDPLKTVGFHSESPVQLTAAPAKALKVVHRQGTFTPAGTLTITGRTTATDIVVSQFRTKTCTAGNPGC